MRGFYAGLIAGIVAGISLTSGRIIESILKLVSAEVVLTLDFIIAHFGYAIGATAIFGGIFGAIYSKFYHGIPGKGVKNGFVFGLLIYLLSNVYQSSRELINWLLTWEDIYFKWIFSWGLALYVWIPYGVVLGFLYERWK